jgi:hypothetical protein
MRVFIATSLVVAAALTGVWGYQQWRANQRQLPNGNKPMASAPTNAAIPVRLSKQARDNLSLVSKPLQATTFWRTIELPGVIVNRPGVSDRGVVSPVSGVVGHSRAGRSAVHDSSRQ